MAVGHGPQQPLLGVSGHQSWHYRSVTNGLRSDAALSGRRPACSWAARARLDSGPVYSSYGARMPRRSQPLTPADLGPIARAALDNAVALIRDAQEEIPESPS